jgi:hypothetical protein
VSLDARQSRNPSRLSHDPRPRATPDCRTPHRVWHEPRALSLPGGLGCSAKVTGSAYKDAQNRSNASPVSKHRGRSDSAAASSNSAHPRRSSPRQAWTRSSAEQVPSNLMARSIWSGTICFGHIEHLPHLTARGGRSPDVSQRRLSGALLALPTTVCSRATAPGRYGTSQTEPGVHCAVGARRVAKRLIEIQTPGRRPLRTPSHGAFRSHRRVHPPRGSRRSDDSSGCRDSARGMGRYRAARSVLKA